MEINMDTANVRARRAPVKPVSNIDLANAVVVTKESAGKGMMVPLARPDNAEQEIAAAAALPAFYPMQHFARVPRGMLGVHMGGDYPGHYAVVDPHNLEIESGAVVMMRGYDEDDPPHFTKIEWSASWKCWMITSGFRRPGRLYLSDTVNEDYITKRIMGAPSVCLPRTDSRYASYGRATTTGRPSRRQSTSLNPRPCPMSIVRSSTATASIPCLRTENWQAFSATHR